MGFSKMFITQLSNSPNYGRIYIFFLIVVSSVECALQSKCTEMKIMSLNVWGLPEKYGSKLKDERISAIAREVSRANFDVYLLQELWMEQDHDKITKSLPKGYYITGFRQFTAKLGRFLGHCDGIFTPVECSGLAIISKYPFKEVQFKAFDDRGDDSKILIVGAVLVAKGAGRVKIEIKPNLTVDIFTTHIISDPEIHLGYDNRIFREKQIHQLLHEWVLQSTSDVVLVGGDFNIIPEPGKNSVYQMIRKEMKNCGEQMYSKESRWLKEDFATYANPSNTWKKNIIGEDDHEPAISDYIFWRENNPKKVKVGIHSFHLPVYKTLISNQGHGLQSIKKYWIDKIKNHIKGKIEPEGNSYDGDLILEQEKDKSKEIHDVEEELEPFYQSNPLKISVSDHEAVASTLSICRL